MIEIRLRKSHQDKGKPTGWQVGQGGTGPGTPRLSVRVGVARNSGSMPREAEKVLNKQILW